MNDSEVLGMLSLIHSAINPCDEGGRKKMIDIPEYSTTSEPPNLFDIGKKREDPKSCGVCGYRFKPGNFVHELEIGGEVETVCEMCYRDVLRRER